MQTSKEKAVAEVTKDDWFESRPEAIKVRVLEYPPGYYLLTDTGQTVWLHSYTEDSETGESNFCQIIAYNRGFQRMVKVFGIAYEKLLWIEDQEAAKTSFDLAVMKPKSSGVH